MFSRAFHPSTLSFWKFYVSSGKLRFSRSVQAFNLGNCLVKCSLVNLNLDARSPNCTFINFHIQLWPGGELGQISACSRVWLVTSGKSHSSSSYSRKGNPFQTYHWRWFSMLYDGVWNNTTYQLSPPLLTSPYCHCCGYMLPTNPVSRVSCRNPVSDVTRSCILHGVNGKHRPA